jgi:hypothetical protein
MSLRLDLASTSPCKDKVVTSILLGKLTGKYAHRNVGGGIGHNLPQEAPKAFADAIIDVARF